MSFAAYSAMALAEQNTLFHVGLGFRVGRAGAHLLLFRCLEMTSDLLPPDPPFPLLFLLEGED